MEKTKQPPTKPNKNYIQSSASGLGDKTRNQLAEILNLVCLLFQLITLQGKNLSQAFLHFPCHYKPVTAVIAISRIYQEKYGTFIFGPVALYLILEQVS